MAKIGNIPDFEKQTFNRIQLVFTALSPSKERRKELFNLVKLNFKMDVIEDRKAVLTNTPEQDANLNLQYQEVRDIFERSIIEFCGATSWTSEVRQLNKDVFTFVFLSREYDLRLHNSWDRFDSFLTPRSTPFFKNV